jgi:hypothetical protein
LHIPWPESRCIVCKRDSVSTEHLIPESLGGRLTANLLCRTCNSKLGHDLEAQAKHDPSVIEAASKLLTEIRPLALSILESHRHVSEDKGGIREGFVRDGQFIASEKKLSDGSLIQPTNLARKSVEKILIKNGYADSPLQEAMQKFDEAPPDTEVVISPEVKITKWSITTVKPDLNAIHVMNPLIPAKTAFEFLACHLGRAIYEDQKQLSAIRDCFDALVLSENVIRVERLYTNDIKPYHGICFEGNDPYAKIQVRLFGNLAFRVHFLGIAVAGEKFIYTHYLDSKKEIMDLTE